MADYKIGYGKTPIATRFSPGRSGNPKGRPRRQPDPLGEVVQGVLDAPVKYRENGRTKTASRTEVRLKMLLERAVKGDVKAADTLLEERKHAFKHGQANTLLLIVTDFLPDFDGQTAEQKTAAMNTPGVTGPSRWQRGSKDEDHAGEPQRGRAPEAEAGN